MKRGSRVESSDYPSEAALGEVNEAMADVEAGRVPARIVFTPDPDPTR